jgi:hypothetical protein
MTLLIISMVTLKFDESKTEMSVGLSLTIMLVMYTMYQSISDSLIKTAYLKMIDYWLLFCLLMPFVIFMIEIYWMLTSTKAKDSNETSKGWIRNEKTKKKKKEDYHANKIVFLIYFCSTFFVVVYGLIAMLMHFEMV